MVLDRVPFVNVALVVESSGMSLDAGAVCTDTL